MSKIKALLILLISCALQSTLSWADGRWTNLVYATDAQLDNDQMPAYSFKMDPAEKIPYLATILRDGTRIRLEKLVYAAANNTWVLQTAGVDVPISQNSHKVRLALAPNEDDATTTPYIAYVDGKENTLHVFQAQGSRSYYSSWKEIPINFSNVKDIDIAPTNNGVDIAVMDSDTKVHLYKITKNGELSRLITSNLQVPAVYIPNNERHSIKLVVSSASGTETPYLVFLTKLGIGNHNAPQVNINIWTPNGHEWTVFKQGNPFQTSSYWDGNITFDAISCKYGICINAPSSPGMGWGSEGPVSEAFVTSTGEEKFISARTSATSSGEPYYMTPYSSMATDGNSTYSYGFEFTHNSTRGEPTEYAVNSYKFNHDASQWEYTGCTYHYWPKTFIIASMFTSAVMYPFDSQKHFIGFVITMHHDTKNRYVIIGQNY